MGSRVAPLLLALAAIAAAEVKIISLKDSGAVEFNFHDEARGPHYVVGVASPAAGRPAPGARPLSITSNGTRYTCYLPPVEPDPEPTTAGGLATSPAAAGVVPPERTPEQLLDALGDFCAYRVEDWWTYEVCYKQAARQYHSEGGKVTDAYHLGNYSAPGSHMGRPIVETDVGGEVRYVRQAYVGGAPCELTRTARSVEVRYVCGRGPTTVLAEVREPRSCAYVFIVVTPRLCKHSAFQDRIPGARAVVCHPQGGPAAAEGEGEEEGEGGGDSSSDGFNEGVLLVGGGAGDGGARRGELEEVGAGEAATAGDAASEGAPTGAGSKNVTVAAELEEDLEEGEGVDGVALNDIFGGGALGDDYYDD